MVKLKRTRKVLNLLKNEAALLNFALVCRFANIRPSAEIGIADPWTALQFDGVCAHLCNVHDNKQAYERLKVQLNGICAMLGGNPKMDSDSEDDDLEAY